MSTDERNIQSHFFAAATQTHTDAVFGITEEKTDDENVTLLSFYHIDGPSRPVHADNAPHKMLTGMSPNEFAEKTNINIRQLVEHVTDKYPEDAYDRDNVLVPVPTRSVQAFKAATLQLARTTHNAIEVKNSESAMQEIANHLNHTYQ